jgi:hypothetical protein
MRLRAREPPLMLNAALDNNERRCWPQAGGLASETTRLVQGRARKFGAFDTTPASMCLSQAKRS